MLAAGLAGLLPSGAVAGPGAVRFRGIVVDTSLMGGYGVGPFGDRLKAELTRALAREFAGSIVPGDKRAPLLVVAVRSVSLNAMTGPSGDGGGFGADPSSDYLEAMIGVGAPTERLLVSLFASGEGGRFDIEGNEARRVDALARAAAYWTRRKLGG